MKFFRCLFVITAALLLMVGCSEKSQLPVGPEQPGAAAKLVKTEFTAVSFPAENINPGTLQIFMGKMFLRNKVDKLKIESDNLYLNSVNGTISYNGVVNANNGEGTLWGTINYIPDAYPELEARCIWNGKVTMTGPSEWTLIVKLSGYISGGSTGRILIFWDAVITYHEPTGGYWEGQAEGRLLYNQ